MSRTRITLIAVAVGLAFATAIGAASAGVSLAVTPSAVHRGQLVRIHGSAGDCPVGDTVFVISRAFGGTHRFAGVPTVLAKVRAADHFGATTRIPRLRRIGHYSVTARCGGGNLGVNVQLTVLR